MKKFSLALALFLGFGAFNAQAFDLTEAANKMADGINNTAQAIEDKKAEQEAAFKFVRWITTPERAAQWSAETGYVAVTPASYETEAMKKYVADFPQALVARDQLPSAVAELSTHENQRVTKALNDGLQAALTGTKTPQKAMEDAQAEAERILKAYR